MNLSKLRALAKKLKTQQELADYPAPPGCTSPFAPIWITKMVRRQPDK